MRRISLYLIIILFALSSCRSKKVLTDNASIVGYTDVDLIYKHLSENEFKADWFSGKFKGVYHSPDKKQGFSGQIRIRKDSLIWVSLTAVMNIEVARIEITPDSFTFINRLEKTYVKSSIKYLRERIGANVDFEMLQAVILGNDFPYYQTNVFKLHDKANNYLLSTVSRRKLRKQGDTPDPKSKILVQNIWVNKETYKIDKQTVKIVGSDKTKLRVFYDDFRDVEDKLFPFDLIVKLKEDERSYIEFNYNSVEINNKLRFPFRVPRKYTEVKMTERK